MEEHEIKEVSKILTEWNPIGEDTKKIKDINGYKTEATDIIFYLSINEKGKSAENIVRKVLNQAFDLFRTNNECIPPTQKILNVLNKS